MGGTSGNRLTINDRTAGLNVTGAVTGGTGLASITTTGGNLALHTGSVTRTRRTLGTTRSPYTTLFRSVNGNAGTVTLTSGQAISQSGGVLNTTGTLQGSAVTSASLKQWNTNA